MCFLLKKTQNTTLQNLQIRGILDNCCDASYIGLAVVQCLGARLGRTETIEVQQLYNTASFTTKEVVVQVLGRSGRPINVECNAIQ